MARKREWFQTFFSDLYGEVLRSQFSEAESVAQARIVRCLLGLRRGRHVLDIPCGQGRLTIPLARAGLAATGLDLQASYLRRARRSAKREGVAVRFVQGDMRRIAFDAEFDAALCWFTSFGYFSDAENLAFARRLLRALKPGGRLLLETLNKSHILAHPRPKGATKTARGFRRTATHGRVTVTDRFRLDRAHSRIDMAWTLRKGKHRERQEASIRCYNGTELRRLLRTAGFRDIQLYGMQTLRGRPKVGRFTRHAMRLLALARRPEALGHPGKSGRWPKHTSRRVC